jgi:hypothetical protein
VACQDATASTRFHPSEAHGGSRRTRGFKHRGSHRDAGPHRGVPLPALVGGGRGRHVSRRRRTCTAGGHPGRCRQPTSHIGTPHAKRATVRFPAPVSARVSIIKCTCLRVAGSERLQVADRRRGGTQGRPHRLCTSTNPSGWRASGRDRDPILVRQLLAGGLHNRCLESRHRTKTWPMYLRLCCDARASRLEQNPRNVPAEGRVRIPYGPSCRG